MQRFTTFRGHFNPFRTGRNIKNPFSWPARHLLQDIAFESQRILRGQENADHGRRKLVLIVNGVRLRAQLENIGIKILDVDLFVLGCQRKRKDRQEKQEGYYFFHRVILKLLILMI